MQDLARPYKTGARGWGGWVVGGWWWVVVVVELESTPATSVAALPHALVKAGMSQRRIRRRRFGREGSSSSSLDSTSEWRDALPDVSRISPAESLAATPASSPALPISPASPSLELDFLSSSLPSSSSSLEPALLSSDSLHSSETYSHAAVPPSSAPLSLRAVFRASVQGRAATTSATARSQ